jgi:PIN domain nuclease of toxin-antitoxin system
MRKAGLFEKDLLLWPLNEAMAVEIANLGAETRSSGFSLGDRAWKTLRLGVQIQLIR